MIILGIGVAMQAVRAATSGAPTVRLPGSTTWESAAAAGCTAEVDFSSLLAWMAEAQLRYSTNEVAQVSCAQHVQPSGHQAESAQHPRCDSGHLRL
jgi:hypothetical protein